MADVQDLINQLFTVGQLPEKPVYRDEPILITASQMKNYTPLKYREMREIARKRTSVLQSEASIFYRQGKFMEDFEDDCPYEGEFIRYFPTYQAMNDRQLRGYFTWRTKLRRGELQRTSRSFAFVYIYELINGIGVSSPQAGFEALENFYRAYGALDSGIRSYTRDWLKDYVVYYNLDKGLLEWGNPLNFDSATLTLLNCHDHSQEEVFRALCALSSYNIENSRFFKQYPEDIKAVAVAVFQALTEYYSKNRRHSLCEKFFGKFFESPYTMFGSAIFYDRQKRRDYVYEVSPICRYHCREGKWSLERFFRYRGKSKEMGGLLKGIDRAMRERYGFNFPLKPQPITKVFAAAIEEELSRYLEEKRLGARPSIDIDLSKLDRIREAALETQDRLLSGLEAEEDMVASSPALPEEPVPPPQEQSVPAEDAPGLCAEERMLLSCLLYGRPYKELLRQKGLLPAVLADSINEKLMDRFGDTVIGDSGTGLELIEDYIEELKGIVRP